MEKKIRVLAADDHLMVTDMLAVYLSQEEEFQLHQASSADEALQLIEQEGVFDIVMVDVAMPGMHGLKSLEEIVSANAPNPVVLFTGLASRELALDAIQKGAKGCIPKTMSGTSLLNAIKFVISGEVFIPLAFMDPALGESGEGSVLDGLSPLELKLIRHVCAGDTNKEIAFEADISEASVKMHLHTISEKLGARNRTHLAMIARDTGRF